MRGGSGVGVTRQLKQSVSPLIALPAIQHKVFVDFPGPRHRVSRETRARPTVYVVAGACGKVVKRKGEKTKTEHLVFITDGCSRSQWEAATLVLLTGILIGPHHSSHQTGLTDQHGLQPCSAELRRAAPFAPYSCAGHGL